MRRSIRRVGFPFLLGACALIVAPSSVVHAAAPSGVSAPVVIVQQTGDPTNTYTTPLGVLFNTAPTNPLTQINQFFAPNADPTNPTNYFTVTGFSGTPLLIGPSTLTDFAYNASRSTATTLEYDYIPTTTDLPPQPTSAIQTINLGSLSFETSTPTGVPLPTTGSLTFTYFDEANLITGGVGPNSGSNTTPITVAPEPSSVALLALGAVGGLYLRRRMRLQAA